MLFKYINRLYANNINNNNNNNSNNNNKLVFLIIIPEFRSLIISFLFISYLKAFYNFNKQLFNHIINILILNLKIYLYLNFFFIFFFLAQMIHTKIFIYIHKYS